MKQREAIEQWVAALGLNRDNNDKAESFGDRKYKFSLYLLNQDGNYIKLRKGSIHELKIEDDVMSWFHQGYLTISNPGDIIERSEEVSTGDDIRSEKVKVVPYKFRGDCRDLIYLAFEPHIDVGEEGESMSDTIDSPSYTMKFLFTVYATEDVVSPEGRSKKLQKMYFHDYRYQLLREKNLYYSTGKALSKSGKVTDTSTPVGQRSNTERSKPTGEIIQDILRIALPGSDTEQQFSLDWNIGAGAEFYTSPANFKAIDDLNYILDRHVSTSDYGKQPCIFRLERQTEKWHLLPVEEYFRRTKIGILPGVLQTEHFILSNDSETNNVKIPPEKKTFGMGVRTANTNYHFPDISIIDDYNFSEINGVDCQEILNSVISHDKSISDKRFNISVQGSNIGNVREEFQKKFVNYTFGGEGGHGATSWISDTSRNKNYNFQVQYNDHPEVSRNNLLLAAFLLGNTIQFQSQGETSRRAGVWIALDRNTNYIDSSYESKILGQYFVTRVTHTITSTGEYKNNIMGVKPYFYRDEQFDNEDIWERDTNKMPEDANV